MAYYEKGFASNFFFNTRTKDLDRRLDEMVDFFEIEIPKVYLIDRNV